MKKFLLLLSIVALSACQSTDEQAVNEVDRASLPNVNGKFLAAVKPAANSTISFWELEPGLLFVYLTETVDDKLPMADLQKTITADRSVVDIYKDLAKNKINANYLDALQQAQLRKESIKDDGTTHLTDEAFAIAYEKFKQNSSRTALIPRTNCQPDYYQDAYGDYWFYGEFYRVYGQPSGSGTNEYEYTKMLNVKNVQFGAMAADFGATAIVRTSRMNSSATKWIKDYEVTLQPRTLAWPFYIAEKKQWYLFEVLGQAPCPRVHAAYKTM